MKTALVIMAAGMGSRFGGGIKQLEPVGPNGEIIMDYSIHDAIEAGFNKVVFIIRKDIRDAFHDAIGKRIEGICNELNIGKASSFSYSVHVFTSMFASNFTGTDSHKCNSVTVVFVHICLNLKDKR